jgi:hypothetical protein
MDWNSLKNAYIDSRFYKCQCFPGFFGTDCQYGPSCDPDRNVEVCQNGGKCRSGMKLQFPTPCFLFLFLFSWSCSTVLGINRVSWTILYILYNGFAMRISYVAGSTGIRCNCPPGFTGSRCETMYLDGVQKRSYYSTRLSLFQFFRSSTNLVRERCRSYVESYRISA